MNIETTESDGATETLEVALVPEQFAVRDNSSANWVIRKILESRAYAKRCAEWCEQEQARARRTEEFFLVHYQQQLIDFARQQLREENGRRKSVNLPAGRIGFRAEPAKLIVDDEATVIAWAKQNKPALVQTIERLSKIALNQHVETTGEIPPCRRRELPASSGACGA